jgi:2-dehydropantoate 2-reductase
LNPSSSHVTGVHPFGGGQPLLDDELLELLELLLDEALVDVLDEALVDVLDVLDEALVDVLDVLDAADDPVPEVLAPAWLVSTSDEQAESRSAADSVRRGVAACIVSRMIPSGRMKIGILGAGAIGCYLGGKLVAAGHDVVLVGRWGDEIREHGLELTDYAGSRTAIDPGRIVYVADPAALAGVEAVLVTVKSAATEEAARPLASILARPTPIVSFQNGVSNPPRLRAVLPAHPVLAGMVPFNVAHTGPGRFHNGTSGPLAIEEGGGAGRPLAEALRSAGFEVEVHASLAPIQWSKLLVNLNNAVNALGGLPLYEQIRDRGYRRVMAMSVREGLAALRAKGIRPARIGRLIPRVAPFVLTLPDALFVRVASAMVKVDRGARSSMLDDLERRRPTEIDYLNGEIVRLADEQGTAAPVNRKLIDLVKRAEREGAGSPRIPSANLLALVTAG